MEQQLIRVDLTTVPAAELLRLIRLCHPDEHGEPYSRWDVMEEIGRRGKQVLIELGWPTDDEAIYKNRFTGDEEPLKQVYGWYDGYDECAGHKDYNLNGQAFSIMEHWWPKDKFEGSELFDEYKIKQSGLSKWF
jgi:hypothetical protein